jgi:L-alanine-DL-glutamate epimerase-like enolase superfamily enzyme
MIRVLTATAVPVTFRLVEGYRIAGRTCTTADNIILKVTTSDGRTGFGCAAPAEEVTGETAAACRAALDDLLIPLLRGIDAADPAAVADRARQLAPRAPAARAAVDIALLDLQARRAGVPLARLLGIRRGRLLTSVTLGIDEPGDTIDRARRFLGLGFRALKIKVGEDWEADARVVHLLRRACGPDILIRADANQGYTVDTATRFLAAVEEAGLELLEQPTPAADLDALACVTGASRVPIMADESVLEADDARRVAERGAAPLVNIKLMKSGGIHAALAIGRAAAASGLRAMIGCMDESRIGIAAGLHFALACLPVDRADLDGHLDLADDVAEGGVRLRDGCVFPDYSRPGLGVTVDL